MRSPSAEKRRIIVTLTTIPSGIAGLKEVLRCLLHQKTRSPDKIYINLPYLFEKKKEKYRELGSSGVKGIKKLINHENPNNVEVEIVRCEDKGSITKIYPTLKLERDPETLLLICDDDYLLTEDTVEKMELYALKYPKACFTTGGWVRGGKFPVFQSMFDHRQSIRKVDWLEGSRLMCVPRKFFDQNSSKLLDYSIVKDVDLRKLFEKHDDHWISWHLRKNGAKFLSIPERLLLENVTSSKDYYISGAGDNNQSKITRTIQFLFFAREVNIISRYLYDLGIYKRKFTWYPVPMVLRVLLISIIIILILIILVTIFVKSKSKIKAKVNNYWRTSVL